MDKARRWEIYTLSDPRDGVVWYVGVSHIGDGRFRRHLAEAKNGDFGRKGKWIRSLFDIDLQPAYSIVECGTGPLWQDAERKWIAFHRIQNPRLTNIGKGGAGMPVGYKMPQRSQAHIEKLRAVHVGRKQSAQEIANRIAALKGRIVSAETREKIGAKQRGRKRRPLTAAECAARSVAQKGKPWTEKRRATQDKISADIAERKRAAKAAKPKRTLSAEHKAKIVAAVKGRKHTVEARAKIAASKLGKPHPITDEQKAKISATMKGIQFTPEHRANISASAKKRGMSMITAESRAKVSAALKGKPWSPARRAAFEASKVA